MRGKTHSSAKPLIPLGPSLLATEADVPSSLADSDTTKFTNTYLKLADQALHSGEQKDSRQGRPVRSSRLRLEPEDGTPAKDYRIRGGEVLAAGMELAGFAAGVSGSSFGIYVINGFG